MPPLSVMIKPASGLCNMRCRYCFYADETEKRTTPSFGMMTEDTLRQVLTHVLAAATGTCTLAFQGGEPTLAGLSFFQKVIELEKELNVNHCRIEHALQTNGLLIDDAWAEFLAENHFLVGVSLDGPKELHDKNRLDANGKGTWSRVMHAIQILKKHHVEFNILTVVTGDLCRCTGKVTGFYARNGFSYRQFIPCLDPLGEERGQYPWSLTPKLYARYLKDSFDSWYRDIREGHKTYHRYFDNLLLIMDGQWPEACGMGGICGRQFVIEAATTSAIGGVLGIVTGYSLSSIATAVIKNLLQEDLQVIPSVSSVIGAFCISAAIGILFGYLPAKKAARLNPIEALRYD